MYVHRVDFVTVKMVLHRHCQGRSFKISVFTDITTDMVTAQCCAFHTYKMCLYMHTVNQFNIYSSSIYFKCPNTDT